MMNAEYEVKFSDVQPPWTLTTPEKTGEFVRGLLADALVPGQEITIRVLAQRERGPEENGEDQGIDDRGRVVAVSEVDEDQLPLGIIVVTGGRITNESMEQLSLLANGIGEVKVGVIEINRIQGQEPATVEWRGIRQEEPPFRAVRFLDPGTEEPVGPVNQ